MKPSIYVFFEGKIPYWACINSKTEKVRYDHIIEFFLEKLEENTKQKYDITQLTIFLLDTATTTKIEDLSSFVPLYPDTDTEILVKSEDPMPIQKKGIVSQALVQPFIKNGREFCKKGDYRAGTALLTAAEIFGLLDLAKVLYKLKKWKAIETFFPRLLIIFPGSVDVAIIHGQYLEHLGYYEEAIDAYKRAIKFTESPEITVGFSRIFLKRGDIPYANLMIKSALLINDTNPEVILQAAETNFHAQQYELAVKDALRHPKCYNYLAEIAKNPHGFEAIITVLSQSQYSEKARVDIAWILYKRGCRDEALGILHEFTIEKKNSLIISIAYLYLLFIDGRTNIFFEYLTLFFERHICEEYANIHFSEISNVFDNLGHGPQPLSIHNLYRKRTKIDSICGMPTLILTMLLAIFLFAQGNTNEAVDIREMIGDSLCEINFGSDIGSYKTIPDMYKISACQRLPSKAPAGYILAIGDELSLAWGGQNAISLSGSYMIEVAPFPEFSFWGLIQSRPSGFQKRFIELLTTAARYDAVIITLGTYDCERDIPKLLRKCVFSTPKDALTTITSKGAALIKRFACSVPDIPVFMVPAFGRYNSTAPLATHFNQLMADGIGEKVTFIELGESFRIGSNFPEKSQLPDLVRATVAKALSYPRPA